jgi:hypothetical protein
LNLSTDPVHRIDNGNRDRSGDQAVFDGGAPLSFLNSLKIFYMSGLHWSKYGAHTSCRTFIGPDNCAFMAGGFPIFNFGSHFFREVPSFWESRQCYC